MRNLPEAASREPSAVEAALERVGKMAAAGAAPDAVVGLVGEVVAGWAAEADMDAETAQARITEMWDSLTKDEADLEEAISDAGDGNAVGLALAQRMRAALQAAIQTLAAASARFG